MEDFGKMSTFKFNLYLLFLIELMYSASRMSFLRRIPKSPPLLRDGGAFGSQLNHFKDI
jgi:hypothetical protein